MSVLPIIEIMECRFTKGAKNESQNRNEKIPQASPVSDLI
jgi:hypothetical protein